MREPRLEVVQQRPQRAEVEDGETAPVLVEHAGKDRQHRCLGLAAGGRVRAATRARRRGSGRSPAPAVGRSSRSSRSVLTRWCCSAGWRRSDAVVTARARPRPGSEPRARRALYVGQLAVGHRQGVVLAWVEVGELVDRGRGRRRRASSGRPAARRRRDLQACRSRRARDRRCSRRPPARAIARTASRPIRVDVADARPERAQAHLGRTRAGGAESRADCRIGRPSRNQWQVGSRAAEAAGRPAARRRMLVFP